MRHGRILLALFFWLLSTAPAWAQGVTITGQVLGEGPAPVEFATVVLLKAQDSTHVTATTTDATGAFSLPGVAAGSYLLKTSFIGFSSDSRPVQVTAGEPVARLTVRLAANHATALKEVTITATRPTIIQKPDRMIVNISNTVLASGYTALEVLEKSPGIYVNPKSESITLNGKGATVILDGKKTYMSEADLAVFLKGLQSNEVQQIELITSPGARYDAEGPGGVINIVTKKGLQDGTKATVTAGGAFTKNSRQNLGLSLNHRRGAMALSAGYTLSARQVTTTEQNRLDYLDEATGQVLTTHKTDLVNPSRSLAHNYRAGLDWTLSPRTSVNLYLRGFTSDKTRNATAATQLLRYAATPDSTLLSLTDTKYGTTQYSSNLGLRHTIDSVRTISADLDYSNYDSRQTNLIVNSFTTPEGKNLAPGISLRNVLPTAIQILAAQTDYEQTIGTHKLEAGLKFSRVETDNDARYEKLDREIDWVNDPQRTNYFSYKENIMAAYLSYSGKINKLDYRIGGRLENTQSEGHLVTSNILNKRNYTNFFPSILLNQAVGKDDFLSLNYSRRLQRPSYQDLNPFIYFQDIYSYSQGNPFLRPEYANNIDLTYTVNGTYVIAAGYSRTNNLISWVTQRETPNSLVTQSRAENLNSQSQYGLTITAPYAPFAWWNISNFFNGYYSIYSLQSTENAPQTIRGFSGVYGMTNDFKIKGGWNASVSGYFQSPAPYGVSRNRGQYSVNLGLQKKFLADRLALRVVYNDVLKTSRALTDTRFSNLRTRSLYRWDSNFLQATLTYSFGNQKIKASSKSRNASGDEESRIK
ncbi:outer membrane beta-barrel protein [Hymenobacter swuensis]|uniref:outer membrane beta-barrel protein n=1 Tax=Hymenobacter swuensis TaxID=1446467 RepID=UPI0005C60CD8|nr:outer membrane beta-barrel protein [Hymenobacter swuensis]